MNGMTVSLTMGDTEFARDLVRILLYYYAGGKTLNESTSSVSVCQEQIHRICMILTKIDHFYAFSETAEKYPGIGQTSRKPITTCILISNVQGLGHPAYWVESSEPSRVRPKLVRPSHQPNQLRSKWVYIQCPSYRKAYIAITCHRSRLQIYTSILYLNSQFHILSSIITMVKIALAGGSGDVASEIIDVLLATKKHEILILSRSVGHLSLPRVIP